MATIPLSKGYVAIVDDDLVDTLGQWSWTAVVTGKNIKRVYAYRREGWDQQARKWRRCVMMHRFITDAPVGMDVDHINSNTLDNRRCNLRVCTRGQNLAGSRRENALGFRGVNTSGGRLRPFGAHITENKRVHVLGFFATAEEAARAYDEAARKYFGEFARLNFSRR